jgi:GNAT superfamily N-acetyltransferase
MMLDNEFHIRPLGEDDWEAFKTLRLHALRSEPRVFSRRYEDEAGLSDAEWRAMAGNADPERCIFGLFAGSEMIGLTAIFTDWDDPTKRTAVLAMSFLLSPYRGRGLSRLFYETRLDWARARGSITRVRVSHRRSNDASRRANQRYGFRHVTAVDRLWPDGTTEPDVSYELILER